LGNQFADDARSLGGASDFACFLARSGATLRLPNEHAANERIPDGIWKRGWYDARKTGGEFKRSVAAFRN
jgi:hypothetical protein